MAATALLMAAPAHGQSIAAQEMARDALPAGANANRIVTVRADLRKNIGVWTGVRSCGKASRARKQLKISFDSWIGRQTMARPGKLLISYGWGANRWWYENRRRGRTRSCKGGFRTAPVYARFY